MSPRTTAATRSGTSVRSGRRRWSIRPPPPEGSAPRQPRTARGAPSCHRPPARQSGGCSPWTRVDPGSRHETQRDDDSLELPVGWVRRTADVNDYYVTRDGPALNYVVSRQPHDRKLPRTQRETHADMLPQELAELALAEWKNTAATANLELLTSTPVMLGGRPAARVHIRYRNERGLPIERVLVSLVDARGRLSLLYEAPAIVYLPRGLADFESLLASVRFQQK